MMIWPENQREQEVYVQQGRDYLEQDAEAARLDAIAQLRAMRDQDFEYKRLAEKAGRMRKAAVLGPIALSLVISFMPGFEKRSTEQKLIDEAIIIVGLGSAATGAAEFTRRGFIKDGRENAKEAYVVSRHIGRQPDGWILEAMGEPQPEVPGEK